MFLIFKFLKTLLLSFFYLNIAIFKGFAKIKNSSLKMGYFKAIFLKLFLRFAIFKGIFKGRAPTDDCYLVLFSGITTVSYIGILNMHATKSLKAFG
jgi:hypothetical protein